MVAQSEISNGHPVVTASTATLRCALSSQEGKVRQVAKRVKRDKSR
jgi:hypothetical protein